MIKLYTLAQSARLLDIDRRTFEKRRKSAKMRPYAKAGRIELFTEEQLRELKRPTVRKSF
jgi:hypothetical protein